MHAPSTKNAVFILIGKALRAVAPLALVWACAQALAQTSGAGADDAARLGTLGERFLQEALATEPSGALPLRMQVEVGTLDPRLQLAPCARVEPYLPPGSRLWGRTRLGLRCVQGRVAWNVFLPVTVRAFGPAWVLRSNIPNGAVLRAEDAVEAEVDWAAEPAAVLANPDLWVGQTAARTLMAGQALRQAMVRPPELFGAGAQVKVLAQGPGYAVTADGQALSAGGAGQTVRVRMANGRIVSGVVNGAGAVELAL